MKPNSSVTERVRSAPIAQVPIMCTVNSSQLRGGIGLSKNRRASSGESSSLAW
jgi:hypothetical protein